MQVVQMVTQDRVGSQTVPVEVQLPVTAKSILASASKKFKSVTKQSRAYHGATGAELLGEVALDDLSGLFVVLSGKAGWKGAAQLAAEHAANATSDSGAVTSTCETTPASMEPHCAAAEHVEDRVHEVSDLGGAATTHAALLEAAKTERDAGVVLFWKETQDNGYLSNWAKSVFVIDDITYHCAEQWIMASKARACGDAAILAQIMQARSPRRQKELGRSLDSRLVQRYWRPEQKWANQLRGVRAKFRQNEALAVKLLRTGQKPMAEASPSDHIYGIGLAPSDPFAQDPANWKGSNILGKAVMKVREELRDHLLSGGVLANFPEHMTESEENGLACLEGASSELSEEELLEEAFEDEFEELPEVEEAHL